MGVELKIVVNDDRTLSVTGPIDDKIYCYGLLALAQESIAAHHARAAAQLVQPAPPGFQLLKKPPS